MSKCTLGSVGIPGLQPGEDVNLRQVKTPDRMADPGIAIVSLDDLFGTKCATVTQRCQTRDYVDIHALLKAGMTLSDGVSCARAIYGKECNPVLILRALSNFKDVPDLSDEVKQDLLKAVQSVNLDVLPSIESTQEIGSEGAAVPPPPTRAD